MPTTPASTYRSVLQSDRSANAMRSGSIVTGGVEIRDLLDRLHSSVAGEWRPLGLDQVSATDLAGAFVDDVRSGRANVGTPALTNLAHERSRPIFGSCAAGPVSGSVELRDVEWAWSHNMGVGFNLDTSADPVEALERLECLSVDFERSGACQRYVGSIAHISSSSRHVDAFVEAKRLRPGALAHVNTSVDFDEAAIEALDDSESRPSVVLRRIAEASWACGDPGVVSLERFRAGEPAGKYHTVAPCAEVGLAEGQICVFGYLSLPAFLHGYRSDDFAYEELAETAGRLVRVLDVLASASQRHAADGGVVVEPRVAISVCGFADLLLWLCQPYGGDASIELLDSILGTIRDATSTVPRPAGRSPRLTAIAPAGRSALLLGVSPSIEPSLYRPSTSAVHAPLRRWVRSQPDRRLDRAAHEVPWADHLRVATRASEWLDESLSKTVNLPSHATAADVENVYRSALGSGMKAVSVYRMPPLAASR